MADFDLAIIGAGSGNSLVTDDFADAKVAVVERHLFGGTCLNVGCIPTKMFVYAAEVAGTARSAARYGVDARVDGVRWRDIRDRVFGRIDPIEESGRRYRVEGENTTAFLGSARFVGDRRLRVELNEGGSSEFTADQVVIAAGARPRVPSVIADSGVPFQTSDSVMRIDELPSRIVIMGGGVIAAEFAHVFSALGVQVDVVIRGPRMLRAFDEELSQRFTELVKARWKVHAGVDVVAARSTSAGGVVLTLDGGGEVAGDMLLVATGRVPNSEDLDAAAGGVELRSDGRVRVDEFGRTSAEGVWALGDISSPFQLKHVANAEARAVAHNLTHPQDLRSMPHEVVPAAVFSDPQVASVGASEDELRSAGVRYVSKVQSFGDTAYGWALEDSESFFKVLADPASGRILGAHSMGPHSSTLIQPVVMAMSLGLDARRVARDQYWIHPALAEVVENALLGLEFDK
ncbi:Mycothione reductase [Dermatophilus congolensis]|uniref:Mycothione reductase n=1 Tax=Dermatophilus congolensis TaxID=1863 RepID=A0AA46BMC4_9MICO|nr:mycothione reductase [Dermatophilus congolensis]STD06758.1 Mycothione reductase [Dermatophilus congolensis]